jgi:hypothetical protein
MLERSYGWSLPAPPKHYLPPPWVVPSGGKARFLAMVTSARPVISAKHVTSAVGRLNKFESGSLSALACARSGLRSEQSRPECDWRGARPGSRSSGVGGLAGGGSGGAPGSFARMPRSVLMRGEQALRYADRSEQTQHPDPR